MEKIRVLQVVPNMHAAGLETLIMNIYRNIDRSKVQFDFLVHYEERHFYDDEIEKLGGEIHRLSFRNDGNVVKYLKDLDKFFQNHKYLIVHGHMASTACFYLGMAKKHNVPIRILHSHNTSTEKNFKGLIKQQLLKISTLFANNYFSCGELAGRFLYKDKPFTIIHNAINLDIFKPDFDERIKLRKEYCLEEKFVLGHIGRFNSQKNHIFILKMFEKFHKLEPNSVLILVGEGETEDYIRKKVDDLKLNDAVYFLGVRRDVDKIYNMFDVFVLPSLFEGLPVVGVECQAVCKQVLFSNTITKEIMITDLAESLPINDENAVDIWCEKLYKIKNKHITLCYEKVKKQLEKSGYNIKVEASILQDNYLDLLGYEEKK